MNPRFSIRDILLTTLIIGLALGWTLDRWRRTKSYEGKIADLNQRYQANTASLKNVLTFIANDDEALKSLHTYDVEYPRIRTVNVGPNLAELPSAEQLWWDVQRILNTSITALWHQQNELESIDVK